MSGNHADFAAYLAARWPSLVRSLVLLGCTRAEAEQVAQAGLARCYGDWDRVRRADDVDAHVYATVLACLHRWRRHADEGAPRPVEVVPDEEASDPVLLRRALTAQLDQVPPEEREVLVLRFVADLDETQIAEVLDVPTATVRQRIASALGRLDLVALGEVCP